MQDRWDEGHEGCRTGVIRTEGMRTEGMRTGGNQDMRDAGQEVCRKGRMQDRWDAIMQDRWDAGQVGCWKGGVYDRWDV